MLSVCLQLFLYASNGIASKMRTILCGRQLAVSWCTSRVNFDAGLNHSPACRPPASSHWSGWSDHGGFERLFCPRLQRYTDLELDEPAGAPLDGDW